LRIACAFGLIAVLLAGVVPAAGAEPDRSRAPHELVLPARIVKDPRLQSRLANVAEAARRHGGAAALQAARAHGLATAQGKVRVVVEGARGDARTAVVAHGGSVTATAASLTEALVPAGAISALARSAGVEFVRAPFSPYPLGTESQGVAATDADAWHAVGATGSGTKIAVVDTGFAGLSARQASGDLPGGLTSVDYCGGTMGAPEPHGTAVAEIVHEMAPGAQLYLICVDSEIGLANALAYAKANGITVVNHSVGWYNTSRGDGTGGPGTPDAVVADARANGILWVNSAGNAADEHWSGTFVDANSDRLHEFAPGDDTNAIFLHAGEEVCGFLKWDSWPLTDQDFDLFLVHDNYVSVEWSTGDQNGSQPPTEELCYANETGAPETFAFVIRRFSATTAPRFDLFVTLPDELERQTAAGTVLEPATSPDALAVGAICWQNDGLEPYSSRGPTIDGRSKPDLAGPSAVSSAIYGSFSVCGATGFTGTSSASPHVAGAAALVKAMFPLAAPDELQAWLESEALDLGAAGRDLTTGAGKLRLPTGAPALTTAVPSSAPPTFESIGLAGTVSPNGLTTSYHWEYGPTTAYGAATAPVTLTSPRSGQIVDATLTGLPSDADYHYRLVATNPFGTSYGEDQLQHTAPALPPAVVTKAPQEIGAVAARLDSSVTPQTAATTARFAWGETTAYGNETPVQSAGTFGTNPVVAELTGLQPETQYHYRIVATNVHGTTSGADQTFTTAAGAEPTGVTRAASAVTTTQATVAADVTPNGLATTYRFEYSTSPTGTLQQTAAAQAGYGTNARSVSTTLTGLQPGTQYSYRIVVTNSLGTSSGDFATLTTAAVPPPPAPPSPPSGGSGGSGGGGADLAIEGAAQPASAAVGDQVTYVIRVVDLNGVLAQGVTVDVQLPAGSQLAATVVDRGPGCAGAPLVCGLDFLSSVAPVGTIRLHTKITTAGEQTLRATVRHALSDVNPGNNVATVVVGAKPAAQAPAVAPPANVGAVTTIGTAAANTLRGTSRPDTIRGLGGNDRLFGAGGVDRLFGDAGHDWLYGDGGNDRLFGGPGNDRLFGGPGRDVIEGGGGRDVVSARDRTRDTIRCGAGRDSVTADRVDAVARDCERVTRR
jgi:Ca2+-binding RTX toxin-like protein